MENLSQPTPPDPAGDRPARQSVVLSGTAHLLAAVPHLLGYQPRRSVVVMGSTGGRAVGPGAGRSAIKVTARFDLPEEDEVGAAMSALAQPLTHVRRDAGGPLLLHVFVYEADDDVATAVAAAVTLLAGEDGHRLQDLVLVRDGRYLALVAHGQTEEDAAAGWLPVPAAADVPAVADLVLQGRFVADSRADVAARVRRRDTSAAAATELALTLLRMAPGTDDPVDALQRLGAWVVGGRDDPAPRERARIVAALSDRTLRDAVMARWLPRLFSVDEVLPAGLAREVRRAVPAWPKEDVAALDRLVGLAARVPEREAAPLLTLVGAVAWGTGEGTVANEAVDAALEVDPAYTMASLLRKALDNGIPPWGLRRAEVA